MRLSLAFNRSLATRLLPLTFVSCVGTTGGETFSFDAYAQGPATADGSTYSFEQAAHGYGVTLTRAKLHVGALYLNEARSTSVSSDTSCTLSGIYGAEALPAGGFVVDAISPDLQPFSGLGRATSDRDLTGEVWLNGGDVNAPNDDTVILDVAGTAAKSGVKYPFVGVLTIGANRVKDAPPASPGLYPICKQRIVSPIDVDITPTNGGALVLSVDPARLFTNVDFAQLVQQDDGLFHFDDARETSSHVVDSASKSLYAGLHATTAYELEWITR